MANSRTNVIIPAATESDVNAGVFWVDEGAENTVSGNRRGTRSRAKPRHEHPASTAGKARSAILEPKAGFRLRSDWPSILVQPTTDLFETAELSCVGHGAQRGPRLPRPHMPSTFVAKYPLLPAATPAMSRPSACSKIRRTHSQPPAQAEDRAAAVHVRNCRTRRKETRHPREATRGQCCATTVASRAGSVLAPGVAQQRALPRAYLHPGWPQSQRSSVSSALSRQCSLQYLPYGLFSAT